LSADGRSRPRQEAIAAGTARLVGRDPERIFSGTLHLPRDVHAYRAMSLTHNPYGDGRDSVRIIDAPKNAKVFREEE